MQDLKVPSPGYPVLRAARSSSLNLLSSAQMTVVVINEVRFHCPTDLDIVSCIECKRCIRPQAVHHHLRSIHNVNVVDCDVERSIGYKYNNSLNFFSFPDFLDDVPSIRSEKGFECAACKKVCQTRHYLYPIIQQRFIADSSSYVFKIPPSMGELMHPVKVFHH